MPRSRLHRPSFWSALAGMAMAVAIACAVVAMEMAGQFDQRALHFRHRADRLQARLGQIEERLMAARREVATIRQQAEIREQFNRILAAPDGQLIRLDSPDRRAPIHGALAFSPRLAQAILEVTGLPETGAPQRLALRWIRRQGATVSAVEFPARDPGQSDVVVQLAPPPSEVVAVVIDRVESGASDRKVAALPLLRGDFNKTVRHK